MLETFLFSMLLNMAIFVIAFLKKTDKLTDISYSLTFIGIALYGLWRYEFSPVKWLVFCLVVAWAVRLGTYLLIRIHVMGRDTRFDEMRSDFWKFSRFWLLQGLTVWVVMVAASLLFKLDQTAEINTLTLLGAAISIFGIAFEATADYQKFSFIRDKRNKGNWISSGLWKYSRHPNYFGEMLMWYGVYLATFSSLSDSGRIIALVSPLFITFLLVGVSGIPLLEKSADKKWGNNKDYIRYKRATSVLVPLPPKR
jgi:steroid 5-alpha reductase family enzyme